MSTINSRVILEELLSTFVAGNDMNPIENGTCVSHKMSPSVPLDQMGNTVHARNQKGYKNRGHKDTLNIQYKKFEFIRVDNVNSSIPGIQLFFYVEISFCHAYRGTRDPSSRWFSE